MTAPVLGSRSSVGGPLDRLLDRRTLLLTGGALTGVVLAGCGSSGTAGSPSSASPAPSAPPPPGATPLGPVGGSTPTAPASPLPLMQATEAAAQDEATAQEWSGADARLDTAPQGRAGVETDLRWGEHEAYDRVVVETSGEGVPGWWAQLVTESATLGKGDPIAVEGAHMIQVIGRGTEMPVTPELQAVAFSSRGLFDVGGAAIRQVWFDPTVEDQFQLVIGAESADFRVFSLTAPSRLVIDVAHPG